MSTGKYYAVADVELTVSIRVGAYGGDFTLDQAAKRAAEEAEGVLRTCPVDPLTKVTVGRVKLVTIERET